MVIKILFSFSIITFGLCTGYLGQLLLVSNRMQFTGKQVFLLRRLLQRVALLILYPVTIIGAIWVIQIDNAKIGALPLFGPLAIILGGSMALVAARLLKLGREKAGSLFVCGAFSNVGDIGGLICYLFLGEMGFALGSLYKIFVEFMYYTVGFSIAKFFSLESTEKRSLRTHVKQFARDPFIVVAVLSLIIGGFLNYSGIQRPAFYETVNSIFIPTVTVLLFISIGLVMQLSRIGEYLKECVAISLIKFILLPVSITSFGILIGYGSISDGLPLKVLLILSSMPVAFMALIPPSIYNLDLDLAVSCWFFTTVFLLIELPFLYLLVNLF